MHVGLPSKYPHQLKCWKARHLLGRWLCKPDVQHYDISHRKMQSKANRQKRAAYLLYTVWKSYNDSYKYPLITVHGLTILWQLSLEIFWTNQCQPFVMVSMTQVQGAQSTAATDLSIIKGKCIQVLLTFLECQMSRTLLPNSNRSSFAIPKELLSDASNICCFFWAKQLTSTFSSWALVSMRRLVTSRT